MKYLYNDDGTNPQAKEQVSKLSKTAVDISKVLERLKIDANKFDISGDGLDVALRGIKEFTQEVNRMQRALSSTEKMLKTMKVR